MVALLAGRTIHWPDTSNSTRYPPQIPAEKYLGQPNLDPTPAINPTKILVPYPEDKQVEEEEEEKEKEEVEEQNHTFIIEANPNDLIDLYKVL